MLGVMKSGGLGKRPRFPTQSSRCWQFLQTGEMVRLQHKEMQVQDVGQKQKKAEEENTSKAQKISKLVGKKVRDS